jgi:hypothetical protein
MANYGYEIFTDHLNDAKQALEFSIANYRLWQIVLRDLRKGLNDVFDDPRQHPPVSIFEWRASVHRIMELEKVAEGYVSDTLQEVKSQQRAYDNIRRERGLEVPLCDPWAEEEQENMRSEPQLAGNWNRTGTPAPERPLSAWNLAANEALQDRTTMTTFPDPPASVCSKERCRLECGQRALDACECNIEAALKLDPEFPESLKAARIRWHPDKFTVCPEENVELFKKKAAEIFIVVNKLFEARW